MNNLENKKILLVICGGIAAYKSLELIRLLKKKGSLVKTILTKNSQKFITPLSVSSLSQEKIYSDLFDHENEAEMDHISLSRWADLILIAPATANTISKLSYGLADDLASTVCLASNKKILLVPSMNVRMWEHKTNKENINKLKSLNYSIIGPEIGDMACGEYGEGKMTQPKEIINYLSNYFENINNNKKYKALVTAGPTCEFIDPVRFISNKSSGKQGYELANSLKNNGFETILISGPTNQQDVEGVKMIKVNSAKEMYDATMDNLPVDIAIFSAAVSDLKIENFNKDKIKKNVDLKLSLVQNIDILSNISKNNSLRPKLVIGFAAETDNLVENSKKKLDEKNCDWIIANDVSNNEIGFDSDYNEITIFYRNKNLEKISKMKKSLIADKIVERVISDLN